MDIMRNDELAYQALDYIREHPGTWDQASYFCRTSMCYAGTVIFLAEGITSYHEVIMEHGELPGDVAARLLGWTHREGDYVFHAMTNDFGVLERRVKNILNGEIS
jgi:hypothetical protein